MDLFSSDRRKKLTDGFLLKVRTSLQQAAHKRQNPAESFITGDSLATVWTDDCLTKFVEIVKPGFNKRSLPLIRTKFLRTISILVYIGWDEWRKFDEIFFNHVDGKGERDRSDERIPNYTLAILEDSTFLGPPWAGFFIENRYMFLPIVLKEGENITFESHWRLPFVKESEKIKDGAYGKVTKETIASCQFISLSEYHRRGVHNKDEIIVARKRFSAKIDFDTELRNLKALRPSLSNHDHIVLYLMSVKVDNVFNIILPLAEMDLEDFLGGKYNKEMGFTIFDIVSEAANVAGALAFLHGGLQVNHQVKVCCHKDLKPSNILVFDGGKSHPVGKWKITDFGISTIAIVKHVPDITNTIRKTPMSIEGPYQPPEVCGGSEFGRSSDVWSLGCILVRVLVFALEGVQALEKFDEMRCKSSDLLSEYHNDYFHREQPAILNPHVASWLEQLPDQHPRYDEYFLKECKRILFRTLEIQKDDRPFAKDVEGWLSNIKDRAHPSPITLPSGEQTSHTSNEAVQELPPSSPDSHPSSWSELSDSSQFWVECLLKAILENNPKEMQKILDGGTDVEKKDAECDRPLVYAISRNKVGPVETLISCRPDIDLETPDSRGYTPLYQASRNGNAEMVEVLLKAGAGVNSRSRGNETPLMAAAINGHMHVVELLLDRNADCQANSTLGYSSLHYAAWKDQGNGGADLLRLFIGKVDINILSKSNYETPLLTLIKGYAETNSWWEMLYVLVEGGANLNMADAGGNTPLSYAVERNFWLLAEALLERGVDYGNKPLPQRLSAAMKKIIKKYSILKKHQTPFARTPTHELAVEGRNDLADSLGSTSGAGNDVLGGSTTTSLVLVGGSIDNLLGGGIGVDSGHETLNDTEFVVDNLGKRSKAVGGVRGVGEDGDVGLVLGVVDTHDKHGGVSRGSRDDNLLGTTLQVSGGLLGGGENTSGLDNIGSTSMTPGALSGVLLGEETDLLAVDDETLLIDLDHDSTQSFTAAGSPWWFRFINIYSPPAAGYQRIHYICGCGELSYVDVRELSAGGIERFRGRLLASVAAVRTRPQNSPGPGPLEPPPQAHLNHGLSAPLASRNAVQDSAPHYWPSQSTQIGNTQAGSTISQNQEAQFLLVCVNTKNSTVMVHVEVSSLTSDQYLFQQIYQEYQRIREEHEFRVSNIIPLWACNLRHAISMRLPRLLLLPRLIPILSETRLYRIASGDFVRFQLVPIGMNCCPRWFKIRQIPPEAEVNARRYLYKPVPMEDVEFADIPLRHLLKPGPHTDTFWLTTFPKKIRDPLVRLPGYDGQHVIGWGIRINECLNWPIILLSIFIILLAIGAGVILYATTTSDNSSAFALGAFLVAIFTVYITYQYFAWKEDM